ILRQRRHRVSLDRPRFGRIPAGRSRRATARGAHCAHLDADDSATVRRRRLRRRLHRDLRRVEIGATAAAARTLRAAGRQLRAHRSLRVPADLAASAGMMRYKGRVMDSLRHAGRAGGAGDTTASLLQDAARRGVRYLDEIGSRPVAPRPEAIARLAELDTPLPAGPTDPAAVLARLDEVVGPATMGMAGPRFFGFVIGGAL